MGAKPCIGECPPTLGQTNSQVKTALRPGNLKHRENPAGRQQVSDAVQTATEIGRGVDYVRGDNHVKLALREALRFRISLQVEHLKPHESTATETFPGTRNKCGADIRERVIQADLGKSRQEMGGRAAGSGSDLQNSQPAVSRARRNYPSHHLGYQTVEQPRRRRIAIQPFGGIQRPAGKQ